MGQLCKRRAHRHALVGVRLILQRLEEDVELVGDARVGALALGGEGEAAPVLGQPQGPQQIRRVLGQEAAAAQHGLCGGCALQRTRSLQIVSLVSGSAYEFAEAPRSACKHL